MDKINVVVPKRDKINLGIGSTKDTSNYNLLTNKPSINGVTLVGNKFGVELQLQDFMFEITEQDIDKLIYGG